MKIDKLIVDSIRAIPFKAFALKRVSREGLSLAKGRELAKRAEIDSCRTTCEAEEQAQQQIRIHDMWEEVLTR
jgi:hypothetical protein